MVSHQTLKAQCLQVSAVYGSRPNTAPSWNCLWARDWKVPACRWCRSTLVSPTKHGIHLDIMWFYWLFIGFHGIFLAFIGIYGILLAFNLFAIDCQKSYFIGYILYIRFYGIWWILPGKVPSWTTKTWWFNQEEMDSSRSTFRLNASKMGVVDDGICRWMIATVKIPVH